MSFSSGFPSTCRRMAWKSWGRISSRSWRHAVAEGRDQLRELLDPLRVRLLVDAVEGGHAGVGELLRHRLVGGQHELLDDAHAVQALVGDDPGHLARRVRGRAWARAGRSPATRARSGAGASAWPARPCARRGRRGARTGARSSGIAVHDPLDLLVGHARAAPDHAVVELRLAHLAPRHRARGPTVWVRRSWPSTRLQMLLESACGQHGHDAVREIHGRAAKVRLLVQGDPGRT